MISLDKTAVFNIENAMRGARNPLNSWARSDSYNDAHGNHILGENDIKLAERLCKAGSDHRKFIRQIFVSVDICAPLYWWKEYDTYKVGTTANSTSTMHKIHSKEFSLDDFSIEKLSDDSLSIFKYTLNHMEKLRIQYLDTKNKNTWYSLIQLLPSSYNQLRTCSLNYETLINIYYSRKSHKLHEWHDFCDWIETLPYAKNLILIK